MIIGTIMAVFMLVVARHYKCLYLTIGWNFLIPCRLTANLRACAYHLKYSSSAHINFFLKVPSLSKMRFNLEFSCRKTTKL